MSTRTGPTTARPADAARKAADSTPMRLLARTGLAAYGVVHLLVAWLAVKVATGDSGKVDKTGALAQIAEQPGGRLLVWLIVIGLAGLTVWQAAEALWGYGYADSAAGRTVKRLRALGKAGIFAALAVSAFKLASGSGGSGGQQKSLTAKVMELPGGQLLVGLVGLLIMAAAGYVVYYGLKKKFARDLDLAQASPPARRTALRLGQVGYPALGVAYGIVGALVVRAAVTFDPQKAAGMDAALKTLAAQPFGKVLLLAVAAGLACFGAYCLLDARYRRA